MSETEDGGGTRKRTLSNGAVLRFVASRWATRPVLLWACLSFIFLSTLADLAIPWAAGALVDTVADPASRADAAWSAWGALAGLYVLLYAMRQGAFRTLNVFAAANMKDLADAAFRRVAGFSADWHASTFAGTTVRQISRGMWGYDAISDTLILSLGPALLVLVGTSVSIGLRNPLAGAATATVVVAYMAASVLIATRWIRPANLKSTALDSEIGGKLADAIGNIAAVKSFGAEDREAARLGEVTARWREASRTTWNRFADSGAVMNVLLVALQAAVTGLMVRAWASGTATPGDVAFAVTAYTLMSGYLRNFGEIVQSLQKGIDDVEDVARHMRTEAEVADRPGAPDFTRGAGEVRFDRVRFGYKGASTPLYDDFSLTIRPGERVALVGATGAGKSTFVKLVQRLYDVQGGRVLIDGQDAAAVRQESLRRAIAVVPQDPALFHRTVAENIAYGRPDATPDQVALAARRARAHDFIVRLPKGYDTLVGERGVKLSGGERQRVAIARAFLADAPILVLDEATSSLDVETERLVQAAMEDLMEGRTTIVIAHRLSTIRGADRILVFQNGRVVEEGAHGELLARGGAYARLTAAAEDAA